MRKNYKKVAAILGAALAIGGTMPSQSASNDKADLATHTRYADENKLRRHVIPQRKRTAIGTPINQRSKPWFKVVPQKHKKHTNRLHKSHAAKVKRRKSRK